MDKHCGENGLDELNMWKYKIGLNNQIYKKIKLSKDFLSKITKGRNLKNRTCDG